MSGFPDHNNPNDTGGVVGTTGRNADANLGKEIGQKILHALAGIRYGSVEIIIHDSKVVQIERRERVRFEKGSPEERR